MLGNSFRIWFWLGVPVIAAMVLLMPAQGVVAQTKKGVKEVQTLSNQQLADAILTLRTARHTLELANHDYGGHRAAAVRDISASIKQLRLAHDHVHKGKTVQPKKGKGPAPKELQAVSDQQLAASIPALRQTQALLRMTTNDYGGHRAKAVTDLDAAVRQLETALMYSAVKNKDKQ